jgi:hypothetical protein
MHAAALLDRRIVDIPDVTDAPAEFATGARSGKMRVKAPTIGKSISRTLGIVSKASTAGESSTPLIHTASSFPSFSAPTASVPAKDKNVAVSELTPPLPRIFSAKYRAPLPIGPTLMRLPLSCEMRSMGSVAE